MGALKAKLALALALSFTVTIRGFAAEEPLMKEARGLFEPVPSEAPAFEDNPTVTELSGIGPERSLKWTPWAGKGWVGAPAESSKPALKLSRARGTDTVAFCRVEAAVLLGACRRPLRGTPQSIKKLRGEADPIRSIAIWASISQGN